MKSIIAALFFLFCGHGILSAQEPVPTDEIARDFVEDFKDQMITLSKEMVEVAEDVESVADAEAAEPKIKKAMKNFTELINDLVSSMDNMTMKEAMALQKLQDIENDPEVKEWMEKADNAIDRLKADHPDAAAKLEELAKKHSGELQTAMMALMQKAFQMQSGILDEETSEVSEDFVESFKDQMIDMSKEMVEVAEDVESVEDAEAAEPKIEKAMNDFATLVDDLASNMDNMTMQEARFLQKMQDIEKDPEVKEWMEKADNAMTKLKTDHPDAAAKLEELAEKHSSKLQTALMTLTQKAFEMQSEAEVETETSE